MSRSTVAKSRQDKAGKTASAPTPAVTHEIVPGKFNDQDWNSMLDHDDGDEFVADIVEEICAKTMETIFHNYIQRQLEPYTVVQAKDAILQIIEWQFLARDNGEGNTDTDSCWIEDEEPAPAVTDCWAQGSVPRTISAMRPAPEPIQEEVEEELGEIQEVDENEDEARELQNEVVLISEPTVIVEEGTSMAIEESIIEEEQVKKEPEKTKPAKKKGKGYKPHKGALKSAGVSRMTESLEDTEMKMYMEEYNKSMEMEMAGSPDPVMLQMPSSCHSILKLQAGRPPGNREVVYDEQGNVTSVVKVNPDKLPSHRVKVNFKIIDPETEAAKATLDAMRTGKYITPAANKSGKKLVPKPPSMARPTSNSSKSTAGHSLREAQLQSVGQGREGMTPLPPPLIESMEVSAGVVVKEGDRVKRGPRQRIKQADLELINTASKNGLRAITIIGGADPKITVSQILQHQQPTIRPLSETPPIPPIQPRSQVY